MAPDNLPTVARREMTFTTLTPGVVIRSRSTNLLYQIRRRHTPDSTNSWLYPRLAFQRCARNYRFWESAMLLEVIPLGAGYAVKGFYYTVAQIRQLFGSV